MSDRGDYGRAGGSAVYRERVVVEKGLRRCPPSVHLNGEPCKLLDISMSGCRIEARDAFGRFPEGSSCELRIAIGAHVVFLGAAQVVRGDEERRQLALTVPAGFINVPDMLDRHAKLLLEMELAEYAAARAVVPPDYRLAVEALADFYRFHRNLFRAREAALRERGGKAEADVAELTRHAYEQMLPTWHTLKAAAASSALVHLDDPVRWMAMKRVTERALTLDLLGAPLIERAYTKPLGYAGDYRTMTFVYAHAFEGASVTDRVFHRFVADEPLAEGVRRRKDLMKEYTFAQLAQRSRPSGARMRVMSLGCGPALEVLEIAKDHSWRGPISWTLVDQEAQALSLAYSEIYPTLQGAGEVRGDIRCLNVPLRRILKERMKPQEAQDLIYAAGLFDYLEDAVARSLLELLAQSLSPGGMIAVGNARRDDVNFWVPEFLLDWALLYRSKEEMLHLADGLGPEFERSVVMEPAQAYWFLCIRRVA